MPKKGAKSTKNQISQAIKPRRLKSPKYKSFKYSKRIKPAVKLPSAYKILKTAISTIKSNSRLFLKLTLVYGLLTIIFVRGFGGQLQLGELKETLQDAFSGSYSSLLTGATLFSYLVGSAGGSATPEGSVYQPLLIILMSLVTIWTLRQVLAGNKLTVRDAFYKGTYPLVQFMLVLVVIALQLIPMAVGTWLYSVVITNGIAVNGAEKFIWALLAFVLSLLSFYMICSSVFALYIVSLPDMTPLRALRSARQLVLHRRWAVLRKVLFLPIVLLVVGAIIMIPILLFITPMAEWVFFLLSMFTLVIIHAYMYTLYRELL